MDSSLSLFLIKVLGVSLSGVMAPGAVTAATIAAGTRSKHAGALVAVGHGIIEFPLMFLIMAGIGALFQMRSIRIGIGLVGGLVLIVMGVQMIAGSATATDPSTRLPTGNPIWTGVILSGGNPYFLLWWATVGLGLATQARELGALAFGLFAVTHWLCDLAWLEILSQASFRGTKLVGGKVQRIVLIACAAAMAAFGVWFLWDAVASWLAPAST